MTLVSRHSSLERKNNFARTHSRMRARSPSIHPHASGHVRYLHAHLHNICSVHECIAPICLSTQSLEHCVFENYIRISFNMIILNHHRKERERERMGCLILNQGKNEILFKRINGVGTNDYRILSHRINGLCQIRVTWHDIG